MKRSLSKKLSWLLRHGASDEGIPMDAAGWVRVDHLLAHLSISRETLEELVRTNTKQRIQVEGSRVRACQGHSFSVPVTREALEASWAPYGTEEPAWHGTSVDAVSSIAAEGILPRQRTHVHLAPSTDSAVGKRSNVHVLLRVSPSRMSAAARALFVSPNGVVLAREVPAACIDGVHCVSKKARAQADAFASLFRVSATRS
ncbi:MAG: tRNA 2'-phosphotransferase [Myxococcota bacterium]